MRSVIISGLRAKGSYFRGGIAGLICIKTQGGIVISPFEIK